MTTLVSLPRRQLRFVLARPGSSCGLEKPRQATRGKWDLEKKAYRAW